MFTFTHKLFLRITDSQKCILKNMFYENNQEKLLVLYHFFFCLAPIP